AAEQHFRLGERMDRSEHKKQFRLEVSGMTCPSCEYYVEQALRSAGAADATADFRRNEVVFTVTGEPNQTSLKDAVQSIGYVPGEIEILPSELEEPGELAKYRMQIEGMTCTDCERHVVEALQGSGARKAEANFRRGEAHFSAPASVDVHQFEEAGGRNGFQPRPVGETARQNIS